MVNWQAIDVAEHIRQSNLIESIDDEAEVERSLRAWAFLMGKPRLTHNVICETQRHIVAHQTDLAPNERGAYRDVSRVNVQVGSYVPPPWQDVAELMDDWLQHHDERDPWANHVYFEGIHPFRDGNGRAGRMLMWRQQVLGGELPTLFEAKRRFDYYRLLERDRRLHALDMMSGWRT